MRRVGQPARGSLRTGAGRPGAGHAVRLCAETRCRLRASPPARFPKGGDAAPLLADMRGIIATTLRDGVSPELVEAARRQELAQLAFTYDSISGLAESWSNALAFQGMQSPADLARAYAAVTVEDVNRLARKLLTPDHAVTAILTPANAGRPIGGSGFGGAESFGTPPEKPVSLPDWAAASLDTLQVPPPPEAPDVSVLPNGMRLIVVPEHVGHTISVFGQVRQVTDMQEAPGHEGCRAGGRRVVQLWLAKPGPPAIPEGARRYRRVRGSRREFLAEGAGAAIRGGDAVAGRQRIAPGVPRAGVSDRAAAGRAGPGRAAAIAGLPDQARARPRAGAGRRPEPARSNACIPSWRCNLPICRISTRRRTGRM